MLHLFDFGKLRIFSLFKMSKCYFVIFYFLSWKKNGILKNPRVLRSFPNGLGLTTLPAGILR